MAYDEANEAEQLLKELAQYNYKQTKGKVERLTELLTPYIESEKRIQRRKEDGVKFSPGIEIVKEALRVQNILNGINTMHSNAREEVKLRDRITQDLLHAIEFLDAKESELIDYAKDIKETRQMRREAKTFIDVSNPLVTFVNRNKSLLKELNNVVAEMHKLEKQALNKKYTPREKTCLEEAFNGLEIKQD